MTMLTWSELEAEFRKIANPLRFVRLDVQSGSSGEHWRLAGGGDDIHFSRFETLASLAGQKLKLTLPADSKLLAKGPGPEVIWYRALSEFAGQIEEKNRVTEQDEHGNHLGNIHLGSIDRPAEVSAVLCLEAISTYGEGIRPGQNQNAAPTVLADEGAEPREENERSFSFWSDWSDGRRWFMGILSALIIAALIGLVKFLIAGEGGLPEEEIPFVASSEPWFAIQSSFEGSAKVSGDRIEVLVTNGSLSYPAPRGTGSRYIEDIRVSLVETAEGSWRLLRRSERYVVNRNITAGETISLDSFRVTIDTTGLESLAGYWLVFDLAERLPGQDSATALTHSHTRRDLF